jgi:hypothetical protein
MYDNLCHAKPLARSDAIDPEAEMPKISYDPEIKESIDSLLLDNIEVEPGKAFGLPAYYINGKMFAVVYEEGAAIKVPPEMVAELLGRDHISEFKPMGRHTMKSWVLLRREDPAGFAEDRELFQTALEHVYVLSKEEKK